MANTTEKRVTTSHIWYIYSPVIIIIPPKLHAYLSSPMRCGFTYNSEMNKTHIVSPGTDTCKMMIATAGLITHLSIMLESQWTKMYTILTLLQISLCHKSRAGPQLS